jgi:hypothetical protein
MEISDLFFYICSPFCSVLEICVVFIFKIFGRKHDLHFDCLYCCTDDNDGIFKSANIYTKKGCCKKCKLYKILDHENNSIKVIIGK